MYPVVERESKGKKDEDVKYKEAHEEVPSLAKGGLREDDIPRDVLRVFIRF